MIKMMTQAIDHVHGEHALRLCISKPRNAK